MKYFVLIIAMLTFSLANAQNDSYEEEIRSQRVKQFSELTDSAQHVLTADEIENLYALDYFEIDTIYRLQATFTLKKGKKFKMPTTTDRQPMYRRYGYLDFDIKGQKLRLSVYQNLELKRQKEFKDYLFLPFRDATSGTESYGGGRFIDLKIPAGSTLLVDFNRAYNPYCVYSHRYSCPIPPPENTLNVRIEAGERIPKTAH